MGGRGRGRGAPGKGVAPPSVASAPSFAMPTLTQTGPTPKFPKIDLPDRLKFDSQYDDIIYNYHVQYEKKMKSSVFYSGKQSESDGIERYSDRFKASASESLLTPSQRDDILRNVTDVSFLPPTLQKIFLKKEASYLRKKKSFDLKSLTDLEKLENQTANEEDDEEEKEEEQFEDEEEDNDYNANYFDPGDEYLDADDDEEGPTF